MEIRLAPFSAGGNRYFVMYYSPASGAGPVWKILDAGGVPVCVHALRQKGGEEFVVAPVFQGR